MVLSLAVSGTAAQILTVPASCGTGQLCECDGSTCWPTARIGGIRITAGVTFDCSLGSGYLGGASAGVPTAGPIVEISAAGVTLKNCEVKFGTLYGIWAHDTQDVTLIGNTVQGTDNYPIFLFQITSTGGAGTPAATLQKNVVYKPRTPINGSGDNSVHLNGAGLVDARCNVISTESNGLAALGATTLQSRCNAFYMYGRTFSAGGNPIAVLAMEGDGMVSDGDCVVTVSDSVNPLIPTRCTADTTWSAACSTLLSGTCLDPLTSFGPFSYSEVDLNFDHAPTDDVMDSIDLEPDGDADLIDEDGDGIVDWRDSIQSGSSLGLADTEVFGIGATARFSSTTNTEIRNALVLGAQRGIWAAAESTHTHHDVEIHGNRVVTIGSRPVGGPSGLNAIGIHVNRADNALVHDNVVLGTNFGILTNDAAHVGYPFVISDNTVTGSKFWDEALAFGAIQIQNTFALTSSENRVETNTVSNWKGYGLAAGGGASGASVGFFSNTVSQIRYQALFFAELTGTDPIDVEAAYNTVTSTESTSTGVALQYSSGLSQVEVHDNDFTTHYGLSGEFGEAVADLKVYHNVFRPVGADAVQRFMSTLPITNAATQQGNNWKTHCDPGLDDVWDDVVTDPLSDVDPYAYNGTFSADRPWTAGFSPGCDACPGGCIINNTECNVQGETEPGNVCNICDPARSTTSYSPLDCNDANPCTVDSCDPVDGCESVGSVCVVGSDPDDGATGVSIASNVTVTYLDAIVPATIDVATFRLVGPNEVPIAATRAVSEDGTRATLDPDQALDPDTTYRIETTSGVLGPGFAPAQPYTGYFRTGSSIDTAPIGGVSEQTAPVPPSSNAGAAIARCGDLNGDGLADTCVGASGYTTNSALTRTAMVEAGAVLVYLGSTDPAERAAADIIFEGVDPHDRVGVSVAGGFDFNRDGLSDIVIGAEQVDRTTDPLNPVPTGNGKVYLIFFDPSDTVHYPNIADPAVADTVSLALVGQPGGVPGVVFLGASFGDQAGFSVDGGGTSTVSTGTDILIGAPGADPGTRTDAGSVYVIFDSASLSGTVSLTRISSGLPDEIPGKEYEGAAAGDTLGYDAAFTGPTIDSTAATGSIVMGAPGADGSKGMVAVAPDDPDTTPIVVDSLGVGETGLRILGTQVDEQLGSAVDDGGDMLADGATDLLIGAPGYDDGADNDAGRVLQTSEMITSGVYTADDIGGTIDGAVWTGEAAGDQLGTAVAGVGDVTGDGFDDIVLGAPYFDPVVGGEPLTDAGAVYLIDGAPVGGSLGTQSVGDVGNTIAGETLTGTQSGENAGSAIADTGDIDGDGQDDFAVGAPERDADAGTVYLVLESEPPPPGECGPSGCTVADLDTGAEVEVPEGALATTLTLGAEGILDPAGLPAPVPAGKTLLGAAIYTPDGQVVAPPHATIYIPTVLPAVFALAPSEVFPLYEFDGAGWVLAGVSGTTGTNPSYPDQTVVIAVVGVLHTYAVFLNDADADGVRDETDNCPAVPNPSQLDTDGDQIGDACECASVNCDDGNACTDDGCDPTTGCVYAPNVSACEDQDPCTVGDACGAGTCQSGTAIVPPAEADGLDASADKVSFTWSATPGAAAYDVVRGFLSALGVGPGGGDELCFGGLLNASVADYDTPGPNEGFWYVTRGRNACGAGPYGQQSNGTPRDTTTCP